MNRIKDFLIAHGEKIIGAVILVICLWVIATNLLRDSERLIVPGGLSEPVDEAAVRRSLEQVREHLQEEEGLSVWESPDVPNATADILAAHAQYRRVGPERMIRYLSEVPEIPPRTNFRLAGIADGGEPTAYLTRAAAPVEWEVRAGTAGVVVVCRDNESLNWPDDVRVALYRRAVSRGEPDLEGIARRRYRHRRAPELGEIEIEGDGRDERRGRRDSFYRDAPPPSAGGFVEDPHAAYGGWSSRDAFDRDPRARTAPEEEAEEEEEEESLPTTVPERLARTRELYRTDLRTLGATSGLGRGWEQVTESMPAFRERPDPETVLEEAALPPSAAGESGGLAALTYRRRYYAFLDTEVEENTVYQYRMVPYVSYREPPTYVQRYLPPEWQPRVEAAGFPEPRLAFPVSRLGDWLSAQADAFGAAAIDQPPFPAYQDAEGRIVADEAVRAVLPLLNEEPAAGPFTYADLVLTPVDTILLLNAVVSRPAAQGEAPELVALLQAVEVDEDGGTSSRSFSISAPAVPEFGPRDVYVFEGEDGGPARGPDGEPVLRPLHDIYGGLEGVEPAPIGEGENATDWVLVDLRTCRLRLERFRIREVRPELQRELTREDVRAIIAAIPELENRVRRQPDLLQRYLRNPRRLERYLDRVPAGTIPGLEADKIRIEREPMEDAVLDSHEYVVVREREPSEGETPRYRRILMKWPYGDDVEVRIAEEPAWYHHWSLRASNFSRSYSGRRPFGSRVFAGKITGTQGPVVVRCTALDPEDNS
jgi:hypothetical protein